MFQEWLMPACTVLAWCWLLVQSSCCSAVCTEWVWKSLISLELSLPNNYTSFHLSKMFGTRVHHCSTQLLHSFQCSPCQKTSHSMPCAAEDSIILTHIVPHKWASTVLVFILFILLFFYSDPVMKGICRAKSKTDPSAVSKRRTAHATGRTVWLASE